MSLPGLELADTRAISSDPQADRRHGAPLQRGLGRRDQSDQQRKLWCRLNPARRLLREPWSKIFDNVALSFELGAGFLVDLPADVKASLGFQSGGEHFGHLLQDVEVKGVVTLVDFLFCCCAQGQIAGSEATRDVDECLKVVPQIQDGLRVLVNGAPAAVHDGIEVLEDGCSRGGTKSNESCSRRLSSSSSRARVRRVRRQQ